MSGGRNSITTDIDTSGLFRMLDELGDAADEVARPAAYAASTVIYEEVKRNVAALGKKTGNLDRSIYRAFSPDNSGKGLATYHVSWNARKAPHGHLVEWGHLQRYRMYQGNDGKVRPMVRPGLEGTPRPKRSAPQSAKDAYFVPLETPRQIPGKAFVRRAESKSKEALAAAESVVFDKLKGVWL